MSIQFDEDNTACISDTNTLYSLYYDEESEQYQVELDVYNNVPYLEDEDDHLKGTLMCTKKEADIICDLCNCERLAKMGIVVAMHLFASDDDY